MLSLQQPTAKLKASSMTDLHFLTIAQASARIKARRLSPVELTTAFLARVRQLDGMLNSHLLVLEEQAMADATKAEAEIAAGGWKGPLHGIPIGLKDIYNTAESVRPVIPPCSGITFRPPMPSP